MKRTIYTALLPIMVVGFASELSPHILVPSLPSIAQSLSLSKSEVTGLMSSFYLTLSLSYLFAGILSHRFGKKSIMIIASLAVLVGSLMIGLTASFGVMIAGRMLQALGAGAIIVVGQTWVGQSATERNITKLFSYLTIFLSLAPLFAPIIGGFVDDIFSWRYNMYLVALFSAVSVVFMLFTTPPEPESTEKIMLSSVVEAYKELLVNTPFLTIISTMLVCFIFQGSLMSYSSFLFIDELGVPSSIFGFISIPVVLGIIVGQFPVIYLEKKRGLKAAYTFATAIAIAALLGSLSFYLISGLHTAYELSVMLFVFNIGFGGHNLIATRIVMSRFRDVRAYSSALLNFISDLTNYVTAVVVQLLFLVVSQSSEIHNLFSAAVIALLLLVYRPCKQHIY